MVALGILQAVVLAGCGRPAVQYGPRQHETFEPAFSVLDAPKLDTDDPPASAEVLDRTSFELPEEWRRLAVASVATFYLGRVSQGFSLLVVLDDGSVVMTMVPTRRHPVMVVHAAEKGHRYTVLLVSDQYYAIEFSGGNCRVLSNVVVLLNSPPNGKEIVRLTGRRIRVEQLEDAAEGLKEGEPRCEEGLER
jgi:hypothetical protein